MLGKRFLAFMDNVNAIAKGGRLYLWTFTFADAVDYTALRVAWNRLLTYLRRKLPDWSGIRIYEVHPGKWDVSHGLHVHVTCNRRHDVNLVRAVCKSAGWGRVHVKRLRAKDRFYAGKYLAKMKRPAALRGWRLVGNFNLKGATRLIDIFVNGLRPSLFRLGHATGLFNGLKWSEKMALVASWSWQRIAGETLWLPFSRLTPASWQDRALTLGTREDFNARLRARRPVRLFSPLLAWGFTPRPAPAPVNEEWQFLTCWGVDVRKSDRVGNLADSLHRAAMLRADCPF